jgi:hypothetical protein
MKLSWKPFVVAVVVVTMSAMLVTPPQASAKVTTGDRVAVGIGFFGGIGIAAFFIVRGISHAAKHEATLTGCVSSAGSGLSLAAESDKNSYALAGDTSGIKAGDRVKLHGIKTKSADASSPSSLEVQKQVKDYGVCRQ